MEDFHDHGGGRHVDTVTTRESSTARQDVTPSAVRLVAATVSATVIPRPRLAPNVKLGPVTIGTGIPLFGPSVGFDPRTWELTDHTVLTGGAVFLTSTRTDGV